MNEKAFHTLEYNKIIQKLEGKAISPMGKEQCSNLRPMTDYEDIVKAQKETTEATGLILRKGSLPLGGIHDLRPSLQRVGMNGVLSIGELLHVGDFLYVVKKAIAYGRYENATERYDLVENYFALLVSIPELEREISRCIVNDQEVADEASRDLQEIRRSIKTTNAKIKEQLGSILHSSDAKNMLQDAVITIRNGRYCVPVKQEYRGAFKGMIHDQSATGATLFIEPMIVVNANNKIKELETKEKVEIERILRKLSAQVAEHQAVLESNIALLTTVDFIFAKGELSLSMEGSEPIFNTKGYIHIRKGRHPLLTGDVVPIDIYLGKDFATLLITGPNTGGKTVSLKTLGLFTLMGQAGLHIAAFDRSELNIFDDVFADIGDEQSIEQSLSTFSAHMTNIVKILHDVTPNSLVLLDELGAGTDPVEGAALAVAILQFLHRRNIRCAVTTHYSELKVYALSTENVENAACEFDVETLRPTYRLLIGVPGKSNAFAISKRLGLEDRIIEEAKEVLSHENVKFEDLLTDLEINKKTAAIEKDRAEQYRREIEKLKKDLELQKKRLEEQRQKQLLQAKESARQIVMEAKDEADALIRKMQKQLRENATMKELDETRGQIREKLSAKEKDVSAMGNQQKKIKPLTKSLAEGDRVFIHTLNQSGTVVSRVDGNGDVMIAAGIMKIKVNISNLSLDEAKEKESKNMRQYVTGVKKGKSQNIKSELDLRGKLVEESLELVDKYLDDAYLSGLHQVTIIHGKGTGALRTAIHQYLKGQHFVKSFRLGIFGEGDTGVTVVEL